MISLIPFLTGLLCFSPVFSQYSADLSGFYQDAGPSGHRLEIIADQGNVWLSASFLDDAVIPLREEYQALIGQWGDMEVELLPGPGDLMVTLTGRHDAAAYRFVRSNSRQVLLADHKATVMEFGTIQGIAGGPARSTASMFRAYLYRIGDSKELIASVPVDPNNGFSFEGLPQGHYRVYVMSQASTIVQPVPSMIDLLVDGGEIARAEFNLH